MKIQESAENYLETILVLHKRIGNVRSVDIANEMGFTKPSISYAMKKFRQNGYINVDKDGYITLTSRGYAIAEKTYKRHLLLTQFLMALGVSEETAKEDACKIEHYLSEESFKRVSEHYNKISDKSSF
jgi:DtxR family Mn-dependent transcriptional regulator